MKPFRFHSGNRKPYISCQSCHLVCRRSPDGAGQKIRCPRCGAALHYRRPHSLHRTWALIIAAYLFYIPANVLPITRVVSFGKTQSDTIISGVFYFFNTGMWPIALIIFIASILVPLFKLIILSSLLVSVRKRSARHLRQRTLLYRLIEAVGRWSMLDIFVVTILVALVRLGEIASVEAGPAAIFFAAVVVSTMFAADSFDPRLMWDAAEMNNDGRKTVH
jgi:paraquat-inducible protein A